MHHPPLHFAKSHGLGNDFVLVEAREDISIEQWRTLAPHLCDRHRGIGADGLIVHHPSAQADARMQIINSDGSEPEMCGNGLRTFVHYLHQHQGFKARQRIETGAGILSGEVVKTTARTAQIKVQMGAPRLGASQIPALGFEDSPILNQPLILETALNQPPHRFKVSLVSMGNPHCIVPVNKIPEDWHRLGKALMEHPQFPEQANIEFVVFHNRQRAEVKVWERGVGPTQACGTGACAVAVAGQLLNELDTETTIQLPGGDLFISWEGLNAPVYMTGPSEEVYSGIYALEGVL